jgi:hypothetical protein
MRASIRRSPVSHDRLTQPTKIIAEHIATWAPSPAFVELAIFETEDAMTIARALNDFCCEHVGAEIGEYIFCQSSIGSVHGVVLDSGRRVVVKAHQPDKSVALLREIARAQAHLAERRLFAPAILAGPAPLGRGHAMVEPFIDIGATADAHRPEIRHALAGSLQQIVEACRPLVASMELGPHLLSHLPTDKLWPRPHGKLFDFEATVEGAGYIDALASAARERIVPCGDLVIGHTDWRAEHVRFMGDRPVAAFDWDSLCKVREPFLIGFTAHAYCADYSVEGHAQAPTLDEARGFVTAYEQARGHSLDRQERHACGGAFAYSCAYTARCEHALGLDQRDRPGTFQHLVAKHAASLFDL